MGAVAEGNRLRGWQHSSRIIRVSRASGGKDRHSKVWTAKGPRDRRVRLSVATAIQFYDLQDRLGFDQPSKAVEWLIKSARDAIDELPSLEAAFPETPRQQSGVVDSSAEHELELDPGFAQAQQQQPGSNVSRSSACSSNSENSKGSGGLSLSRNENRVKARERARERSTKDKAEMNHQQLVAQQSSSSTFTQLLTAGIGNMGNASSGGVGSSAMDGYFNATGLMGASSSSPNHQILHLGSSGMMTVSPFSTNNQNHHQSHHHELKSFPYVTEDHYNLNFSPSSGFNVNRGTLQSNSPQSLLPQLQRFSPSSSSQLDGTTMPFFLGTAVENQHHHQHGPAGIFPPGLQLYYGDNGGRQSDHKGKGKN